MDVTPSKSRIQPEYDDYYDEEYELESNADIDSDKPEDYVDSEKESEDFDFGDDVGIDACNDEGPELGSEEIALNREYIVSSSARAFSAAIQKANLSLGCKRAFQQVVDVNFSKDVFLAYVSAPRTAQLNLKLSLAHVNMSCIPHDINQPELVQLKTNILEAFPFILSRGIGGRERYYQGLHRSESRSGESVDSFTPEKKEKTSKLGLGWKNILKRN